MAKNRDADFARSLRRLRADRDLSQEDLASAIGVSVASVQNWEDGMNMPAFATALALADYFGVTVEQLAGRA